jgi:hypothetical protein
VLLRAGGRVDPIWKGSRLVELIYRGGAKCEKCEAPDWVWIQCVIPGLELLERRSLLDVAHLDGDTCNEADTNLAALCRKCHRAHDLPAWAQKFRLWVIQEREKRLDRKDGERPLLRMEVGR